MIRRQFIKALAGFMAAVPFVRPRPSRPSTVVLPPFDVLTPAYEFSLQTPVPEGVDRVKYFQTLTHLTGRFNDAPFKGYQRGELLLRGASVNGPDAKLYFALSPYAEYLPTGYRGWDYRQVQYMEQYVQFVDQLYDSGDFSALGV